MRDSPTSKTESDFVCECDERVRSACAGEPFYKEYEGKRCCVFHFPGKAKTANFEVSFQRKLRNEDFNFAGVWFPSAVCFRGVLSEADFAGATFCDDVDFSGVDFGCIVGFSNTVFCGDAIFENSHVGLACFNESQFRRRANFKSAAFLKPQFESAQFSGFADFSHARMGSDTAGPLSGETDFIHARFDSYAIFRHTQFLGRADFMFSVFEASADFHGALFQESARFFWTNFNGGAEFGLSGGRETLFK